MFGDAKSKLQAASMLNKTDEITTLLESNPLMPIPVKCMQNAINKANDEVATALLAHGKCPLDEVLNSELPIVKNLTEEILTAALSGDASALTPEIVQILTDEQKIMLERRSRSNPAFTRALHPEREVEEVAKIEEVFDDATETVVETLQKVEKELVANVKEIENKLVENVEEIENKPEAGKKPTQEDDDSSQPRTVVRTYRGSQAAPVPSEVASAGIVKMMQENPKIIFALLVLLSIILKLFVF